MSVQAVAEPRAGAPAVTGPTLAAHGIVKRFGSLVAVDHAELEIGHGIHALLGENGAGKSTLVKALYGYVRPDAGEILVDGRAVGIANPGDARRFGIGLVFQQFTLIPALTVTENVALFLPDLGAVVRHGAIADRIAETASRYGLAVDPARRVGTLSLPEQQRVEILRVLLSGARFLIFDEPTSALPAQEIDALFEILRRLRDDGYPILVITHKLREVFAIADTVTVMRRGAVVATKSIGEVTEESLVELMFGEAPPDLHVERRAARPKTVVVELRAVTSPRLSELDLAIAEGEIVGVAGVAGNGQRELCDVLTGVTRISRGKRILFGIDATRWSVRKMRDAGVGFVPESALGQELIWNMTLAENIALGSPRRFARHRGFALDWPRVRESWQREFAALDLDLPPLELRAGTLSGGNAQRFAVARELAREPRLLVLLYPTRGLDVPTTRAVQQRLMQARDRGCAILLVSQDLQELRSLSDRLLVMRDGAIVAELAPKTTDAYEIGTLMTSGAAR